MQSQGVVTYSQLAAYFIRAAVEFSVDGRSSRSRCKQARIMDVAATGSERERQQGQVNKGITHIIHDGPCGIAITLPIRNVRFTPVGSGRVASIFNHCSRRHLGLCGMDVLHVLLPFHSSDRDQIGRRILRRRRWNPLSNPSPATPGSCSPAETRPPNVSLFEKSSRYHAPLIRP